MVSPSVGAGAGGPRDDLVEERRAAIMAAAEQLLAVHGFDAMRLRDVAQQAGVSIGLIQHYFNTRDELLFETMRTASRRRAQQWVRLATGAANTGEKITGLLEGAISDPHRCVIWLETCAASTRHPELRSDVQLTQQAWREAIQVRTGRANRRSRPAAHQPDRRSDACHRHRGQRRHQPGRTDQSAAGDSAAAAGDAWVMPVLAAYVRKNGPDRAM